MLLLTDWKQRRRKHLRDNNKKLDYWQRKTIQHQFRTILASRFPLKSSEGNSFVAVTATVASCNANTDHYLPARGFLLVFYSNHSPKVHRSELEELGQTDRWMDRQRN